jgi:hypothetical protein
MRRYCGSSIRRPAPARTMATSARANASNRLPCIARSLGSKNMRSTILNGAPPGDSIPHTSDIARFHASTVHCDVHTYAGAHSIAASTPSVRRPACANGGGTLRSSASCTRYSVSSALRCNAFAMAVSVVSDTPEAVPFSNIVYQLTPTPANVATSSRRRPATRRCGPLGKPTSAGWTRARRSRRNWPSSLCRSLFAIITLTVILSHKGWLHPGQGRRIGA